MIRCFADIIAMRPSEGAPLVASQYAGIGHQRRRRQPRPSHADAYRPLTIKREGPTDNMTIGFCGDRNRPHGPLADQGAVALFEYQVILIARRNCAFGLCSPRWPRTRVWSFARSRPWSARTGHPLHDPRAKGAFLDEEEFDRVKNSFVLNPEKLGTAKKDMIILHPLPRVNEITRAVDNDSRAAYFRQVENGKFVRMALILTLLRWADRNKPFERTPVFNGEYVVNEMECSNRRCISATEDVDQLFYRTADGTCRCAYCEAKAR
ncbi:MAG: aspartate carbamoyltransferase [Alistipes finegoldii]